MMKKENAEHTMLVDLGRNDLSKTWRECKGGSLQKKFQFYSHVIHLVSKVTADVPEKSAVKLLADTFPAGTLSGGPKIQSIGINQ